MQANISGEKTKAKQKSNEAESDDGRSWRQTREAGSEREKLARWAKTDGIKERRFVTNGRGAGKGPGQKEPG